MKEKKIKVSKHKNRKYNKLARQMKSVMGYTSLDFARHKNWVDDTTSVNTPSL